MMIPLLCGHFFRIPTFSVNITNRLTFEFQKSSFYNPPSFRFGFFDAQRLDEKIVFGIRRVSFQCDNVRQTHWTAVWAERPRRAPDLNKAKTRASARPLDSCLLSCGFNWDTKWLFYQGICTFRPIKSWAHYALIMSQPFVSSFLHVA